MRKVRALELIGRVEILKWERFCIEKNSNFMKLALE